MVERDETYEAFDLALRVGEILLSSGAGAADVTTTMLAVTRACGVSGVTTDVTYTDLTLRHQPRLDAPAAIQVRHVTRREVDYETLTEVDLVVHSLVAEEISREEAGTGLLREARRLETRLSGPRMVGPLLRRRRGS